MSTNIPAQPAPPDYAASTKEGIMTDIETLGTRRAVDQAAKLGKGVYANGKVMKPEDFAAEMDTAKKELDKANANGDPAWIKEANARVDGLNKATNFDGLGDDAYAAAQAKINSETNAQTQRDQLKLREELGVKNAEQTAKEIEASDPLAYKTRKDTTQKIDDALNGPDSDIKSSENVRAAETRVATLANNTPQNDDRLDQIYDKASDINTKADDLGQIDKLKRVQTVAEASAAKANTQLGSIYDQATRLGDPSTSLTANAMNTGLGRTLKEFQQGGELDTETKRQLTNDARAGQAARGNYLGDAAAVVESANLGQAAEARKQQRLENLLSAQGQANSQDTSRITQLAGLAGQGVAQGQAARNEQAGLANQLMGSAANLRAEERGAETQKLGMLSGLAGQDFSQNQAAFNTSLGAAGQALGAAQARAANEQQTRQENFGRDQQKLANASAIVMGQPITNQFGSLGAAQNGAVAFNPTSYQAAPGVNFGAGQQANQFALGQYGQQGNMWSTMAGVASQDNANKWGLVSGLAGGGLAGALGLI